MYIWLAVFGFLYFYLSPALYGVVVVDAFSGGSFMKFLCFVPVVNFLIPMICMKNVINILIGIFGLSFLAFGGIFRYTTLKTFNVQLDELSIIVLVLSLVTAYFIDGFSVSRVLSYIPYVSIGQQIAGFLFPGLSRAILYMRGSADIHQGVLYSQGKGSLFRMEQQRAEQERLRRERFRQLQSDSKKENTNILRRTPR